MIVLLDTSTPICNLTLTDGGWQYDGQWEAGRGLAKGLLGYLKSQLEKNGKSWADITAIGVFQGPGSFTGLRIGLAVLNTIADSQAVPIVGGQGDAWQAQVLAKLEAGDDEKIVLPFYGSEAHITKPRK